MMPANMDWQVRVWMVQAHRGELVQINMTLSRHMIDDDPKGMMLSIAQQMDRRMLEDVGHVDEHRLWFTDDWAYGSPFRGPRRPDKKTWLLDGPDAGKAFEFDAAKVLNVPNVSGGVNEYETHRIGNVRVGVFRSTYHWTKW